MVGPQTLGSQEVEKYIAVQTDIGNIDYMDPEVGVGEAHVSAHVNMCQWYMSPVISFSTVPDV